MSRGNQPKLSDSQGKHLLELHDAGTRAQEEFAGLFSVSRSAVYRELQRRLAPASS